MSIETKDIWQFMSDSSVVGLDSMKERARRIQNPEGRVELSDVPYIVGDSELAYEFITRCSSGRYVRAAQCGTCTT